MSIAVCQEEPCGGERLHQGARGDQDHEGPEDPGDSLRGQHRRPPRPLHGIQPRLRLRDHLPRIRRTQVDRFKLVHTVGRHAAIFTIVLYFLRLKKVGTIYHNVL